MANKFYSIVHKELSRALPVLWKQLPVGKLSDDECCQIRHLFRSNPKMGPSRLIHVLVLPSSAEINETIRTRLIELRDAILSREELFMVIHEEQSEHSKDIIGDFIASELFVTCPNFVWIVSSPEHGYLARVDGGESEDLHLILHAIWTEELRYFGPIDGIQPVNLEMMRSTCRKCDKPIKIISGIVFPDIQCEGWDNGDWLYYQQLFPLNELKSVNAKLLQRFVDDLKRKDPLITPVGWQYDREEEESCLTASCPHCRAPLDTFEVLDDRMRYLHTLESRQNGNLDYTSVTLVIDQEMINRLSNGGEASAHACPIGWRRG